MKKTYFMGIDTGTFESKGVIIDKECNVIATHTATHGMENPKPNYFEHDADAVWWHDFCLISNALLQESSVDPKDIQAVGASALGADCLPVDKDCNPLRKAILYGIDARATKEMEWLTEYYGEDQIKAWYGRPLCSSDVMPKILWIKNNEPGVYAKTYKFLTGSSFITAKLTGKFTVDRFLGLASFNPLYHSDGTPNPETCKPICRPDQLADVMNTVEIAGHITAKAAKETGLAEGTPVIVGTDDSGAEAISTGVLQPGDMMLQFGSSIYMILCADKLVNDDRIWREEFIVPGTFDVSAGTNAAGTLTRWYRDNIFTDCLEAEKETGVNAYSSMMEGIDKIPIGCDGLITLPYFAGERTPINDPLAKGMLFGLTLTHTRQHMYRSALEAVGYSINQHFKIFEEDKVQINKIMAVGGGTKNPAWMQMVADITGKTIGTAGVTIGASFGDAMMAAMGIHYFDSFADLSKKIKPGITYTPNMENHEKYEKFQKLFDELYLTNKDLMHQL
ncbi:FGGY-family carbohydrate kinase [Caproiciproducens galactitolivorans]|uniref:FGGY-family carbohydrate kinase n=1 Tax=Caproiciproducens galactitolivorans TaxID=642589 RepID=A0ABT4BPR6_9FIRM|nr:FGGY-family carbohydrate kinase [Caproiciproducens galactitolivorans]MCY1712881.1 FGGY-family carbohydrate kinase [Caproiciproducens galactitolivorans]